MQLNIDSILSPKYPGLRASIRSITGVTVRKITPSLEELKKTVVDEVKSNYALESLKGVPVLRAYRDFFWRVSIDPTKVRPAAEALIRRILAGKSIPTISTLVNAYNLASIQTSIPLAAFDQTRLRGGLLMRAATAGEAFLGIGMDKPMSLNGGEIVVSDGEKLIAVCPYRDADSSKMTEETKALVLMVCGCPGIEEASLERAEEVAVDFILRFCGGKSSES